MARDNVVYLYLQIKKEHEMGITSETISFKLEGEEEKINAFQQDLYRVISEFKNRMGGK